MSPLFLAALLAVPAAAAPRCVRAVPGDVSIAWTAYKTPGKVGVRGRFVSFRAEGPRRADSWRALVLGQRLTISAAAAGIDTGLKSRDAKIARYFFEGFAGGPKIAARVVRIDPKDRRLVLSVTMNGRTVDDVWMTYRYAGGLLKAKGTVDALDWDLAGPLAALTKACAPHLGQTWPDVEIALRARLHPCR